MFHTKVNKLLCKQIWFLLTEYSTNIETKIKYMIVSGKFSSGGFCDMLLNYITYATPKLLGCGPEWRMAEWRKARGPEWRK